MFKVTVKDRKGILLFMVLGTILIITILATVILSIILNQSRITHHQVSRIQAYYAAQAGMNLALEMLRAGTWVAGNSYTWTFNAGDFRPPSIVNNSILIRIMPPGSDPALPGIAPVVITVNYTAS